MKNQIIPILQQQGTSLVDAKTLHSKLNNTGRFRDWITYRIKEYGFEEGRDYFAEKVRETFIGRPEINYHLTLDMAKELAMLERSETGRQIRRYFIAVERKVTNQLHLTADNELFKGLKPRKINDRKLYPYQEMLQRCGYSTKSSSSNRKARYWMHFVKEGNKLLITEEFALHLHKQKQVLKNRESIKTMQPVLALDFGNSSNII